MFEEHSRYTVIENATYLSPDGRHIAYKRRRFLPQGDKLPQMSQVRVIISDRLDTITARALGDPEQFWQICDANNAMNPFDLTADIGRALVVPIPQFPEER